MLVLVVMGMLSDWLADEAVELWGCVRNTHVIDTDCFLVQCKIGTPYRYWLWPLLQLPAAAAVLAA